MKTKISLSILALGLFVCAFGQKPTIELTFTAIDSGAYVQLDSINVLNQTQGGDTVLYWPDTVLVLDYQVGITEFYSVGERLQVFQNYPNPVKDQTTITLFVPEKDNVGITITDMLGRKVINTERLLDRGYHSFRYFPGEGEICFFNAFWQGTRSSIKILTPGNGSDRKSFLEYTGSKIMEPQLKSLEAIQTFSFNLGDALLYVGYAVTVEGVSGSDVIQDAPQTNEIYEFEITEGVPCSGIPSITYEGQVYHTVIIGDQCWLRENMNIGTMIPGSQDMTNDGIVEKYCYGDSLALCNILGGLYMWPEMMQYTTQEGAQGICPDGWHLPTDEEWKILEGTVDSQYGVGDPIWNTVLFRGFDAGINLQYVSGWFNGGGTNLYGFAALPGGYRGPGGGFWDFGNTGGFYSSTQHSIPDRAWWRYLAGGMGGVYRGYSMMEYGHSVRCLKD